VIVWLDGTRKRFLRGPPGNRTAIAANENPRKTFSQILTARRPLYANIADIRIDTSVLTDEEVAVRFWRNFGE
jgi:shikimate kinase